MFGDVDADKGSRHELCNHNWRVSLISKPCQNAV